MCATPKYGGYASTAALIAASGTINVPRLLFANSFVKDIHQLPSLNVYSMRFLENFHFFPLISLFIYYFSLGHSSFDVPDPHFHVEKWSFGDDTLTMHPIAMQCLSYFNLKAPSIFLF
jgi:hypothetical protein